VIYILVSKDCTSSWSSPDEYEHHCSIFSDPDGFLRKPDTFKDKFLESVKLGRMESGKKSKIRRVNGEYSIKSSVLSAS
jgi:hypothetical protein